MLEPSSLRQGSFLIKLNRKTMKFKITKYFREVKQWEEETEVDYPLLQKQVYLRLWASGGYHYCYKITPVGKIDENAYYHLVVVDIGEKTICKTSFHLGQIEEIEVGSYPKVTTNKESNDFFQKHNTLLPYIIDPESEKSNMVITAEEFIEYINDIIC